MTAELATFIALVSGRTAEVTTHDLEAEESEARRLELEDAGPADSWPDDADAWHWTPSATR